VVRGRRPHGPAFAQVAARAALNSVHRQPSPHRAAPDPSPRRARGGFSGAGTTGLRAPRWRPASSPRRGRHGRFANIDPEEFYDFQATRPQVALEEGITRRIDWPDTVFYHAPVPGNRSRRVLIARPS
jgi:hypothetical protein